MRGIFFWLAWSVVLLLAAQAAPNDLAHRLSPAPPCAALLAAAQTHHIPLEQIDPAGELGKLDPGDSVTALVTLFEKGARRTQWLLYLEASTQTKPVSSNDHARMVMYSSAGAKLEFVSAPAPVKLRTLGPFDASAHGRKRVKAHDKSARFTLNKDYLALGLDHTAVALMRLRESKVKGSFTFSGKPFTEREITETRKLTDTVKLTSEEQRAIAGSVPALFSYFNIVQQTEGLSDILFELVDLPSVWSLLRKGGVSAGFRFVNEDLGPADGASWNLPDGAPAYHLPMMVELNKHAALRITFVVTNPRPPLLACGGIVGMLAERPGDKHTYLTFRLLSARRAANKSQPSS